MTTALSPRSLSSRLLHSRLAEALTYPYGVDRYLELLNPLAVRSETRAEISSVRHQTPRSVTLSLDPNRPLDGLRAGHSVNLTVEIAGVRQTRPYSPAGSQHARGGSIELTVSTHPDGLVSRYLRDHAKPGMIVGLSAPQGSFTLPEPRPRRVLLIAGGSGITPVMAMLRTLRDERFTGEVGFLQYARSPDLALYTEELEALAACQDNIRLARGYTRGGDGELAGRFALAHARAVMPDPRHAATFVCGPPALIGAVQRSLRAARLPAPSAETFTPEPIAFDAASAPVARGQVSFTRSTRQAPNSGLPLLEQAEDAGLAPEHGCRMGICNTCSTRKTSGRVRNVVTGETSSASEERIRICVSVPLGDVELDL
ncbi:MAG: ferredoxin reductase [Acidobacteriota bacterium]|nr:ferredoxin reductase [Acidobacteriota bacterium]